MTLDLYSPLKLSIYVAIGFDYVNILVHAPRIIELALRVKL